MDRSDRERVVSRVGDLYSASLNEHGAAAEAVGWRNRESQWLRFDKLVTVVDRTLPVGLIVNDLGCGYGAMFDYLADRFGDGLRRYHGYEVSAPMLAAARAHVEDDRAEFVHASEATRDADYSFVSGTFNVKLDATDAEWTDYVKSALMDMASRSAMGLAFNLLTTYVDWRQPHLYYGDPYHFTDFCRRNISRYVNLLQDYPLYEWTIVVRK